VGEFNRLIEEQVKEDWFRATKALSSVSQEDLSQAYGITFHIRQQDFMDALKLLTTDVDTLVFVRIKALWPWIQKQGIAEGVFSVLKQRIENIKEIQQKRPFDNSLEKCKKEISDLNQSIVLAIYQYWLQELTEFNQTSFDNNSLDQNRRLWAQGKFLLDQVQIFQNKDSEKEFQLICKAMRGNFSIAS